MPVVVYMQITDVVVIGDSSIMVIFDMDACLNDVGSGGYSLLDYSISALNSDNWRISDGTYDYSVVDVEKVTDYNDRVIIHAAKLFEKGDSYYLYPSIAIKDETETYSCNYAVKTFVGEFISNSQEDKITNKKYVVRRKYQKELVYTPGLILDVTDGIDLLRVGMDTRRIIFRRITFGEKSIWHDLKFGAGLKSKSVSRQSAYDIKRKVLSQIELDGGVVEPSVTVSVLNDVTKIFVSGRVSTGANFSASIEAGSSYEYG